MVFVNFIKLVVRDKSSPSAHLSLYKYLWLMVGGGDWKVAKQAIFYGLVAVSVLLQLRSRSRRVRGDGCGPFVRRINQN